MDPKPERKATLTLTHTTWSGWDREGYPVHTWAKLRAGKGMVLSPETVHRGEPGGAGFDAFRYEIEVERIVEDRVSFVYRKLVPKNPDGTINLTLENSGRFVLRCGDAKHLATPTMDAGISVSVELHVIS